MKRLMVTFLYIGGIAAVCSATIYGTFLHDYPRAVFGLALGFVGIWWADKEANRP